MIKCFAPELLSTELESSQVQAHRKCMERASTEKRESK